MQVTFPEAAGYAGMFFVGQRMRDGVVERTGTVVLKRAYRIDSVAGTLEPTAAAPVRTRDYPDNLVVNGDFELSRKDLADGDDTTQPGAWPVTGTVAFLPAAGVSSARGISIATDGSVAQTIELEQPLGGRTFTLSLYARTDSAAPLLLPTLAELTLAGPDVGQLCVVSATLDGTMQRYEQSGTWPADVTATTMRVVIHGTTSAGVAVHVDRVQLEERAASTRWDPETILRYESDLAPVKPEADLIVLGYDGAATVNAKVDGQLWLTRSIPAGEREKAAFGWESRADPGPRKSAVGTVPPAPPPPPATLLPDFDNAFYNGFRRDAAVAAHRPFTVPGASAEIDLERGAQDYHFQLRGDLASAVLAVDESGSVDPARWQRTTVPMTLDTIVVEPDDDRCVLAWRGVWPFDDTPVESYRSLIVTASE